TPKATTWGCMDWPAYVRIPNMGATVPPPKGASPMPTFVQLANTYSEYFVTSKRDSGEEYIHLKDGAPEALTDLVREAHDARGCLMMPDDYRYEMVREAIDTIAELDADADEDAARD